MAAGQWSLALDSAIPKAIRDLIDYFGHIYLFDSPVRTGLSDATMISLSRWGGIVRRRQTPWNVGGVNQIAWLGDEDGNGPIIESAFTGTNATFATFIAGLLPTSVTSGSIGTVGGTKTITYGGIASGQTPITPRQAIDNLCALFSAEYRVNKNATFDAGQAGSNFLFKTTPTAAVMRRSSGRDTSIVGISTTQLDISIDAEEYTTRALVQDGVGGWTAAPGGDLAFRSIGSDSDGTLAAWTTDNGTPSIAANVVTTAVGDQIHAGHADWVDGTATIRVAFFTGGQSFLAFHHSAGRMSGGTGNGVYVQMTGTSLILGKFIAGTPTTVNSTASTQTNATVYWLEVVASGTTYTANLYNDSAGAKGTLRATTAGTISDVSVQNGDVAIQGLGASTTWGGAFANVCTVLKTTSYRDLNGNLIRMTRVTISSNTPAAHAPDLAYTLALNGGMLRQEVTLGSDQFDIPRDVVVGDWVWVYDEDGNLKDVTNQIRYRGSFIYPMKLRVMAMTWPIERGMSVWYRSATGVWTDLTNYVVFESPGVSFEVGAAVRPLTKS